MIAGVLGKIKTAYYRKKYIAISGKALKIEGFPQFRGAPKIYLGDNVTISPYTRFRGPGEIRVGNNAHLSSGVIIDAKESVVISDFALVGEYTTITDSDHDYMKKGLDRHTGFVTRPVSIGRNVWIGSKCTILKGSKIGDNVVVGANTVVSGEIKSDCVVAGSKWKVIKDIDN